MKIVLLDDQLQELITDTYGIFQLYFYKNLFEPSADSKKIIDEFLTKQLQHCSMKFFQQVKRKIEENMQIFARNNL